MVSFFENPSKNIKPKMSLRSPPKLNIPAQMQQKIIMPAGGIPKYYGVPQKQKHKSPRYVRNVDVNKPPEKIDKEKIKNNMNTMKALLEKKGVYKRPYRIEPPNYNQLNNQNNAEQQPQFSQNKFLAAKSVFEPKNNANTNTNKYYENKPVRKDIKKKAKFTFQE